MKFSENNINGTKMSKAFWEGFREAFKKRIWVGIAFAIGISLGNYAHPYETCCCVLC